MTLGEKLRYLREVEGTLRGLDRELSQQELARLIQKELGKSISQSYLSQIESGARPHLTNSTRMLLARFFKVHPGYLVDDPEGFQNELISDIGRLEDKLDLWLVSGAERFCRDADLHHALLTVARHADSRMCLVLLGTILDNPGLAERLLEVLKPGARQPANRGGVHDLVGFLSRLFPRGLRPERAGAAGRDRCICICRIFTCITASTSHLRSGGGAHGRDAVVQFRHHRRVPGLVRRHGLSAGALLRCLVRGRHLAWRR